MSRYNPTLAKCPACRAEMTRYARSWRWVSGDWMLWFSFLLLTGIGSLRVTFLTFVFVFVLAITWNIARDRLYHSYWLWRHPLRCEKGGHVEPQLSVEGRG